MKVKLPSRGRGLFREEYYSICSAHQEFNQECSTCKIGSWHNVWLGVANSVLFKVWPALWIWNANRPKNKTKWLKSINAKNNFPNLR